MSNGVRIGTLLALGLAMWALAALYIRCVPGAFSSPLQSVVGFVAALPAGWLSIRLVQRCARLERSQLVAGVAFVGAVAMMMDGAALRFFPSVYSNEPNVLRPASAWLLWGYGVALLIALWSARKAAAPKAA